MILKRRSEKLLTKAKATLVKEQEMTMAILMRGVQADDIGGGIGMSIGIHILDGRRAREGLCSFNRLLQFLINNTSSEWNSKSECHWYDQR